MEINVLHEELIKFYQLYPKYLSQEQIKFYDGRLFHFRFLRDTKKFVRFRRTRIDKTWHWVNYIQQRHDAKSSHNAHCRVGPLRWSGDTRLHPTLTIGF